LIRILLVIDMTLLRTALTTLLSQHENVAVVAAARSTDVTADLVSTIAPDVAVIDLDTRRAAPLAAAQCIADGAPKCGVLALTAVAGPAALRRALDTKVRGFLSKECDVSDLVSAVMRVAAGERYIEPGIAIAALSAPRNPLTTREIDVLRLAAEGYSPAEIAAALFLTHGTVRNYLSTIVRKLGARGRVDAIRTAVEANWL
jgi:two-component system, NarL family, response regulator DesR